MRWLDKRDDGSSGTLVQKKTRLCLWYGCCWIVRGWDSRPYRRKKPLCSCRVSATESSNFSLNEASLLVSHGQCVLSALSKFTLTLVNLMLHRCLPPRKVTRGLFNWAAFKSAPFTIYCASTFVNFLGIYAGTFSGSAYPYSY